MSPAAADGVEVWSGLSRGGRALGVEGDAVSGEVIEQVLEVGGVRVRGVHDQVRKCSEGAVDFELGWVH